MDRTSINFPQNKFNGAQELSPPRKKQANNPAAKLIGVPALPANSYLSPTPLHRFPLANSETYTRSGNSPVMKCLGKEAYQQYQNTTVDLGMGKRASVGGYGNTFQMLGDTFEPPNNAPRIPTSPGAGGELRDEILNYKQNACDYIVKKLTEKTEYIQVGYYNQYPCLMVFIKLSTILKSAKTEKTTDASFFAWVNILLSCFVGLVNYKAKLQELPIEIRRRSSFGFLSPTAAPTDTSFRIELGVTPKAYHDIICQSLLELNKVLTDFCTQKEKLSDLGKDVFLGTNDHAQLLSNAKKEKEKGGKEENNQSPPVFIESKKLFDILWAQADISGKTALQNIERTSYALDGIAASVYKSLINKKETTKAFYDALVWGATQVQKKDNSISFIQSDKISYGEPFSNDLKELKDLTFWQIIESIYTHIVKNSYYSENDSIFNKLKERIKLKNITNLYFDLELCAEFLFINVIKKVEDIKTNINNPPPCPYGDGAGSDSDEEGEVNKQQIYSRKIITHNGMRAIWAALKAGRDYVLSTIEKKDQDILLFLGPSYYEVKKGLLAANRLVRFGSK